MSERMHLPVVDEYRPPNEDRSEPARDPFAAINDPTRAVSCVMCDGLYLKANGELPCWCDAGEDLILDRLSAERLLDPAFDLMNHERLVEIRTAFHVENRYPFSECGRCAMVEPNALRQTSSSRDRIEILHVESSWLCNLDCPLCIPKAERKKLKEPPYNLDEALWVALVHNLTTRGVKSVKTLHFEGRGDPLMHANLAKLCRIFRAVYPETVIMATTNGNFVFDEALFAGGLRHLRISADGARPDSYVRYRRDGAFGRVYAFMKAAAEARQRLGLSDVFIEWKYILFEWNDSDEEMLEAYEIAGSLGIELTFCLTPWAGKSLRFDQPSLDEKIQELMPLAKNRPTRHIELGFAV